MIEGIGDTVLTTGAIDRATPLKAVPSETGTVDSTVKGQSEAATASGKPAAADDPQQIEQALKGLDTALKGSNISLKFSRDPETGKTVLQFIDDKSGETIDQFPSAAMLHLSAVLGKMQGLVFSRKA